MISRPKLKATLLQEFGTPFLDQPVCSTSPGLSERTTAHGGGDDHCDRLPIEGDIVGGHYRLVRRLGEGMFGCVYVAERTDVPEHRVALKVINRVIYAGRNVERELVMLAAATHPNIVQLKDHGMTDDYVWLTMPLYDGETLGERLERGPLGLRAAYDIFVPIARGIQALHARGLRHQDIKPENIFLAEFAGRLHPVLLDLGVAVEANATFVAGTALYGAPEQIVALGGLAGRAMLSEKMDTYCLAATLLRSLVGQDFFPGECARTPYEIATAFEERELAPLREGALPTLSGEPRQMLAARLSQWLTRDPDQRPSAGTMAEQLDVLLEQEREVTRAIELGVARQKTALRRVRIALGAMALIGAGAALYGFSKRETWRLAQELDRARAEGAASFDKLDTCVAAHQLAQGQVRKCVAERKQDALHFHNAIAALESSSEQERTALNDKITTANGRLRWCEDEYMRSSEAWQQERTQLNTTLTEREAAWTATERALTDELNEQKTARATCNATLASLTNSQTECRSALASCAEKRDACTVELAAALQPPASAEQAAAADPPEHPASDSAQADDATPSREPAGAAPDKGAPSAPNE